MKKNYKLLLKQLAPLVKKYTKKLLAMGGVASIPRKIGAEMFWRYIVRPIVVHAIIKGHVSIVDWRTLLVKNRNNVTERPLFVSTRLTVHNAKELRREKSFQQL